jgi:hypothetical protein
MNSSCKGAVFNLGSALFTCELLYELVGANHERL